MNIVTNGSNNVAIDKLIKNAFAKLNITKLTSIAEVSSSPAVNNVTYQFKVCDAAISSVSQLTKCEICFSDLSTSEEPYCYKTNVQKDIEIGTRTNFIAKQILVVELSDKIIQSIKSESSESVGVAVYKLETESAVSHHLQLV